MKIVSNTGPIIGLAKIGKLDLLEEFSEEILTKLLSSILALPLPSG